MLINKQVPEIKKAVNVICEMSEDEEAREMLRLREKTIRYKASRLGDARNKGIAKGVAQERANIKGMRAADIDEETIRKMQNMRGKAGENVYYGQK